MRKLLIVASLTVFLANGLMMARAEDTVPAPPAPSEPPVSTAGKSPIRLKVGFFIPTNSATQKATKNVSLFGGLTYDLSKNQTASRMLSGFLDVVGDDGRGSNDDGLHARYFALGVGPQLRRYTNPSHRMYFGAGLGLYVVQTEREYRVKSGIKSKESTSIKPGGKLFGGIELGSGLFGELSYAGVGGLNGLNASGLGLAVGLRL